MKKYDAQFPSTDRALQLRCADGRPGTTAPQAPLPPEQCPGNRRWIQIMFDAFLLQQGDTSMLSARDAYLAADRMRFGGANQAELWNAFAKRGMGESASTDTNEDDQPKPGFDSPLAQNATVTFATGSAPATIYVGRYEARATPLADTDPATALGATAKLVPGTYDVLVRAPGYGLRRFTLKVAAGQTLTQTYALAPNVASKSQGASASGDGTNLDDLIDDTESTTWDWTGSTGVAASKPSVTISFARRQAGRLDRRQRAARPERPGRRRGALHGAAAVHGLQLRRADGELLAADELEAALHEPVRRVPVGRAAAAGAGPDAADVRRRGHDGDADPLHGARQPVHGRPGLPGRAGRGPAQPDRLRHRVGPGHVPARRRARGVLAERDRIGGRVGLG